MRRWVWLLPASALLLLIVSITYDYRMGEARPGVAGAGAAVSAPLGAASAAARPRVAGQARRAPERPGGAPAAALTPAAPAPASGDEGEAPAGVSFPGDTTLPPEPDEEGVPRTD